MDFGLLNTLDYGIELDIDQDIVTKNHQNTVNFKEELRGKIEAILYVWPLSHVSIFDNIIPISFHLN